MTEYTYRLIADSDSIFRSDGACITAGEGNTDYHAYLAWVAEGNTPDPAPEPPAPAEPTAEEKLKASGLTVDELKSLLGLQ